MKTLLPTLLMAAGLGAGAVQAQAPAPTGPAVEPAIGPTAEQASVPAIKRCPAPTGSRISRAPEQDGRCSELDLNGRSYSKEDIERTGEFDLNQALQRLDPAITSRMSSLGSQR